MRLAAIVVLCAIMAACAAQERGSPAPTISLDQTTRNYLEGRWFASEGGSRAVCSDLLSEETSYEIEFRRTGGSVWVADSVDNDARVKITGATRRGKTIRLTLEGEDSRMTMEQTGPDSMRVNAQFNNPDYHDMEWAYRCNAARHEVVQDISPDMAIWFTMRAGGGPVFVETGAGQTEDLCRKAFTTGGISVLEFELIGPSSFYIAEWKDDRYRRNWSISGSRVGPDGTITFSTKPKSATPSFTVKQTGNDIYVRELDMKLMRCAG